MARRLLYSLALGCLPGPWGWVSAGTDESRAGDTTRLWELTPARWNVLIYIIGEPHMSSAPRSKHYHPCFSRAWNTTRFHRVSIGPDEPRVYISMQCSMRIHSAGQIGHANCTQERFNLVTEERQ